MKFLARRLAACAAIASFACLLTVSAAHEHKDHKVEGIRLNHDDKQHVRHHHHRNQQHHHHQGHQGHRKHKKKQKKPIKPNPPAVFETRELDLICDHFLVDTLVCKTKVEHPTGALTALNNGGNVIKEFIKMDSPCSSEPPEVCSAAAATAGAGKNNCRHGHQVHKRGRHVRHQKTHKIKGHNGRKHHANRKHHKHNKNCKHRKHHKHPKHGGHSKHHGKHHHHQKPKHPYEGLCVSVGKFCGSKLFGCNFNFTTLYTCSAVGEKPVVTLPNAPACTGTPFTRPCECSASSKPTCGSQLPAECHADPAAIYYCPGGPGSKYEIQKICDPGSQCRRPVAGEPICGFASCKCIGTEQVCAQQFPDDCNLEKNTVYQCTTDGQPEAVKSCDGDKTCISVDAEATCTSTDCKCPTDGTVCGEAFPLSCNLPGTILFDCKKGQDPVLSQNCLPGRCTTKLSAVAAASLIFEASAVNDKCADSCKCISAGDVCGSTFPIDCGFDKLALYTCSGAGSVPSRSEVCAKGCVVNGGDDSCSGTETPGECTCPTGIDKPFCGSQLPASCNPDPTVIYHCPDGPQSTPKVLKKCHTSTQCNPGHDSPTCGFSSCNCTGDGTSCSQEYPEECQLVPNSLYKCSSSGTPELVKTCENSMDCVSVVDGSVCASKDCRCPDDGVVCGDVFPLSCRLPTSALYTCKKGESPTLSKDCIPGSCSATLAAIQAAAVFEAQASNNQCIDQCVCTDNRNACGSTFSPSCGLDSKTLYKCSGSGSTPQLIEQCTNGCSVQSGGNICSKDPCTCSGPGTYCGSQFPTTCGLASEVLYSCSGTDATPEVTKECSAGCQSGTNGQDQCNNEKPSECQCKGDSQVCGWIFPASCKLDNNTLYNCPGANVDPTENEKCPSGVCQVIGDVYSCMPIPETCKCQDNRPACGSTFAPSCQLDSSTLYYCPGGAGSDPVVGEVCPTGKCFVSGEKSWCEPVEDCSCKDSDPTCGSEFPEACKFDPHTLYTCTGAGATPSVDKVCSYGCLAVNNAPDQCKNGTSGDDCKCQSSFDSCGSRFPISCAYDQSSLFTCSGPAADPVFKEKCPIACSLETNANDSCMSAAPPKCTCDDNFDICGGIFNPICGYDDSSLYSCAGSGSRPVLKSSCPDGCDVVKNNNDVCKVLIPEECLCQGEGSPCGSRFPDSCGYNSTNLYACRQKGEQPLLQEKCSFGCIQEPNTIDKCGGNPACLCQDSDPTCGSAFPSTCALGANTLYTCAGPGSTPEEGTFCAKGCSVEPGPDHCTTTPIPAVDICKCKNSDAVCGSEFPDSCGFRPSQLYTCSGEGSIPGPGTNCVDGCSVVAGAPDHCTPPVNDCKCKDSNAACGGTFPASCNLDSASLYTCSEKGAVPTLDTRCDHGCTVNLDGSDQCVQENNECKCKDGDDTCGSEFPASCNLVPGTLYTCSGAGSTPAVGTICSNGCDVVANGPDHCTVVDNCKCKDDNYTCGGAFPPSCNLDIKELYACTTGETPYSGSVCSDGCSINPEGSDQCIPHVDDCTCKESGAVCGSAFPPACYNNPDTLYLCSGPGATPVVGTVCTDGCTLNSGGPDECTTPVNDCTCKDTDSVCGGVFPASCNLDVHTLYSCSGPGATPKAESPCTNGCTPIPNGSDECAPPDLDCTCKDSDPACGSSFPAPCSFVPNTLYACSGAGATPEPGTTCAGGCVVNATGPDQCHPVDDCTCKDATAACGGTFPTSCNLSSNVLYTCSGAGATPVPGSNCTDGCINNPNSPDECAKPADDCNCKDSDAVCGSEFPVSCSLAPGTLYTCSGAGATPVPGTACALGCTVNTNGPDECTPPVDDCTCKDDNAACGGAFPSSCNLSANTLYTCSGAGAAPTESTQCDYGCNVVLDGPDSCQKPTDDCTCKDSDPACGSTFPDSCNFDSQTLYTCSAAGATPVAGDVCTSGCTVDPSGPDSCAVDCSCKDNMAACGGTFPVSCNLTANTLYTCSGAGANPVPETDCANGCINNLNAPDECRVDCSCKIDGPVCGSTFPDGCNFNSSALYSCSAIGTTPELQTDCPYGCKIGDGPDACRPPPECLCKSDFDACGSEFPASCGYPPDSLYTCAEGELPKDGSGCTLGCSQSSGSDDICNPFEVVNQCLCVNSNDRCGQSFPSFCQLTENMLYSCPGPDQAPVESTNCTFGCLLTVSTSNDTCALDPDCVCKDDGTHCGSFFPEKCNLQPDGLYKCTVGIAPNMTQDCLPGICSANIATAASIDGNSFSMTTTDDFCIDQCACLQANATMCASKFPAECGYGNSSVVFCDKIADVPAVVENCTLACDAPTGTCVIDPCACRKAGDTCGSSFPQNCSYAPNTLYTCSGPKALPQSKQACENNEICIPVAGGNDICGVEDTCDCVGSGDTCSSLFAPSCNYPADTVVSCPSGNQTTCGNGCAGGLCQNGCACTDDNSKCGSSFAPSCNLMPNAMYSCATGQPPVLISDCGEQACVANPAATCQDPCLCKDSHMVCGSAFPDSCGYSNTSVYECSAAGATPSNPSNCTLGCEFSRPDNQCYSPCAPLATNITGMLEGVIDELKGITANVLFGDDFTAIALTPFTTLLIEVTNNLTNAGRDADLIAAFSGSANSSVVNLLNLLKESQDLFPVITQEQDATVIQQLENIVPLLQQLVTCTGNGTPDCVGSIDLFHSFIDTSMAFVSDLSGLIPDLTPGAAEGPFTTLSQLLTKAVDGIEWAFTNGNTTDLVLYGRLLNRLVGTTSGNTGTFGSASNALTLLFLSAEHALSCVGIDITDFSNPCIVFRARLNGILNDIIKFIQDNARAIPVLGPMIVNPLIAVFKSILTDSQQGAPLAVAETLAIFDGLVTLVNITVPGNVTNPIRDYLTNVLDISGIPPGCADGPTQCQGLYMILKIVGGAAINIVGQIPVAGAAVKGVLPVLVDGVLDAADTGTLDAIQAAHDALLAPVEALELIPGIGTIARPFQIFLDTTQKLLDCIVGGPTTTATTA